MTTYEILKGAKAAVKNALLLDTATKNNALFSMAKALEDDADAILSANKIDIDKARDSVSEVMLDRLSLNAARIKGMADGIREVAALPDCVGETLTEYERGGLTIKKVSAPIGVVAIIYESRPNVTSDAAALSLKSGNVCVLRGGKESFNSNKAIVNAMREGLKACGLQEDFVNLIEDTTRESAKEIMTATGLVDLLIPRGGAGLINACVEGAKVPCIQTGTGICHIYVDKDANLDMALNIIDNAKTSRPSVCNAAEVCLVDTKIAEEFLPRLKKRLVDDKKQNAAHAVELRLDGGAAKLIDGVKANESDFDTEFLDYILAVKIVDGVDEAVEHISLHSTGHSEAIITDNEATAKKFIAAVDSAAVYVCFNQIYRRR